jgi:NhaC family Na+:H+ antiporter
MEGMATLGAFALMLVAGTALGAPLPAILLAGLALFVAHGLRQGISAEELARAAWSTLRPIGSMLFLFAVVGALTAAWRASGTIPAIVSWSSQLIAPGTEVIAAFLMCCLMSMLMGTAFGTAATMGVICMTIAHASGANELLVGGAILSGCYFGDRCSPMSTSASLVSELTKTSLFENVRRMLKTGAIPFLLACAAYLGLGIALSGHGSVPNISGMLGHAFSLTAVAALPAVIVIVLSLAKVSVVRTMLVSLACSCVICVGVQGVDPAQLPQILLMGYQAADPQIAGMVNGGGVISMVNVMLVVAISSCYAGVFERTGLLDRAVDVVNELSQRSTPFVGVLATSAISCMVACNQTLAIVLTKTLCEKTEKTGSALALDLENSVVIMSPLVPWSVSNVAVLASVGAPSISLVAAAFCYLLPLWTLGLSMWVHRSPNFSKTPQARLLGLTPADNARSYNPAATTQLAKAA